MKGSPGRGCNFNSLPLRANASPLNEGQPQKGLQFQGWQSKVDHRQPSMKGSPRRGCNVWAAVACLIACHPQ